jgi:pimeloyl-ACP methyl ester carboxylesterase
MSLTLVLASLCLVVTDPVATRDPAELPIPFDRYVTRDEFGREITWYMSRTKSKKPLPLVVFIQGSGNVSHFTKQQGQIAGGLQMPLLSAAHGRARILIVEKPGVKYLELPREPGGSLESSAEYRREDTLPRWAAAVGAAIAAARTLPGIDSKRTLVVGHSEGGHVAGRVALRDRTVTHVACLSTSGPTQLFDLMELARQGHLADKAAPADQLRRVQDAWRQIQADPDNADKFFAGHTYRHWSSYIRNTLRDDLINVDARIYLAQGTRDGSVPVSSFDVLYAELLARGKDVTAERVDGVDHGFCKPGEESGPPMGIQKVFSHVISWFFADPKRKWFLPLSWH